jgi:hypothetical protein
MEDTWESRDLLVLDAVVSYFEEHAGTKFPQVYDIADLIGRDSVEVYRALRALRPTYVELSEVMSGGDPKPHMIVGITDEARRAVGQWPTAEGIVDRLTQGLLDAADREPDERKRSRLRAVAEGLRSFARDVAVEVISNAATAPLK